MDLRLYGFFGWVSGNSLTHLNYPSMYGSIEIVPYMDEYRGKNSTKILFL